MFSFDFFLKCSHVVFAPVECFNLEQNHPCWRWCMLNELVDLLRIHNTSGHDFLSVLQECFFQAVRRTDHHMTPPSLHQSNSIVLLAYSSAFSFSCGKTKAEKAGLHEARSSEVPRRKSKLTVNLSFPDHQSSMKALMNNI